MNLLEEKLYKARAKLIHRSPFFAMLAIKLIIRFTEEDRCSFDGKSLTLSAGWVEQATIEELMFVWAESGIKSALCHPFRMGRKEKSLWSRASSIVTNPILSQTFTIPPGYPHRTDLEEMSVEKVYEHLLMEQEPGSGENKGNSNRGNDNANGDTVGLPGHGLLNQDGRQNGDMTDAEYEEKKNEWPRDLMAAAISARQAGDKSEFCKKLIDSVEQSRVDWRDKLRQCLDETARNDYSFYYPDRKYAGEDIIMPSLRSPNRTSVGVLLDVSGSMNDLEIANAMAEVSAIVGEADTSVVCYQFDTKVLSVDRYEPEDLPIKGIRNGSGGTDIIPPFHLVGDALDADENFSTLIIFTDMGLWRFPEANDYPNVQNILWVVNGSENPQKQYGELIQGEILNLEIKRANH